MLLLKKMWCVILGHKLRDGVWMGHAECRRCLVWFKREIR